MNGVTTILGTAVDWQPAADGIAIASVDDLVAAATSWSGLPEKMVRAALDTLTLTRENLSAIGNRAYLETERRGHRLSLRPLPLVNGQVWILSWVVSTAQHLHGGYLASDRLPYPAATVPRQATDAMTEYRKGSNSELEQDVRSIVYRPEPAAPIPLPATGAQRRRCPAADRRDRPTHC